MSKVGDTFKVEMLVNEPIIDAQEIKVMIRKPNSIVYTENDYTSIDTNLNIIKYTVNSSDNDIAGEWTFQVRIKDSEGNPSTSTSESIFIDDLI